MDYTEAELEAINSHGLFNLKDFLPKQPTEAELKIIKEMFEASVDGEAYDPDRWGQYYRPWGLEAPAGATAEKTAAPAQASAPATAPVAESTPPFDVDEPAQTSAPVSIPKTTSSDKAQDILAMIKARQNKS